MSFHEVIFAFFGIYCRYFLEEIERKVIQELFILTALKSSFRALFSNLCVVLYTCLSLVYPLLDLLNYPIIDCPISL
uniref:Ovule protein n=1 Tax=Heterorhabditis bacteriophora TaxID=37862 RepID=A0A1I7WFA6_HETBA